MKKALIGFLLIGATVFGECDYKKDVITFSSAYEKVTESYSKMYNSGIWDNLDDTFVKHSKNIDLLTHILSHRDLSVEHREVLYRLKKSSISVQKSMAEQKLYISLTEQGKSE
ncbi:MAG: hypothetical protein ACRCZ0_09460 [Cetobacterium sp.]